MPAIDMALRRTPRRSELLADAAIAAGRLVRILPESRMDQLEVTALQARSVTPSIAVKALLKHLA